LHSIALADEQEHHGVGVEYHVPGAMIREIPAAPISHGIDIAPAL
jgi:hypothetical protein